MRELPVLPLRDPELIIFPGQVCEIDVGRPFSLNAIKSAQEKYDNRIIIAFQNNLTEEQPKAADFYTISMEAEIKQVTNVSATGASRVIIVGTGRLYLRSISMSKEQDCYVGKAEPVLEQEIAIDASLLEQIKALRETIKIFFPSVLAVRDLVPKNSTEFSLLVDEIAHQLKLPIKEKFGLLKQKDPKRRFDKLMTLVSDSVKKDAVKETADAQEEGDSAVSELKKIETTMRAAGMPPEALKIAEQELRRLKMMAQSSSEFQVTLNYLDTLVGLPWSKSSEDRIDIDFAKSCLDEDHFGLEKVKERILEFLAVRKLAPNQKGSILCLAGPPGTGKAQPLDADILTPTGYVKMGDIKVGDKVMTPNGQVADVSGVFPQGEIDIYRVEFSDGTSTECCLDHLWLTDTSAFRRWKSSKGSSVKTLKEIKDTLFYGSDKRKNHSIPMVGEIDFENSTELKLDPYLLGAMLGDGTFCKSGFTTKDEEILTSVSYYLDNIECKIKKTGSQYDYSISKKNCNGKYNFNGEDNRSNLTKYLAELNLIGLHSWDKFVPEEYKFSSRENRIKLLQGLMDTDGSVDPNQSNIEICSASEVLANDVKFLVESLGGKATVSRGTAFYTYKGKKLQGRDRFRVSILLNQNINPFTLTEKVDKYNNFKLRGSKFLKRYISNVELVGKKEAQCIMVDHPDHLYVTNNFIVTHNTSCAKSIARSMNKEYIRMSLGGMHDEAEIRGHRKTYIGAMPGRVMQNLKKVGVNNPVFVLDEIDKLCKDHRGDPASALLEVLDPEQNNSFQDNYINTPFDLSKVFFIVTANDTSVIPSALKDRLEIINIPGYSPSEKVKIAQKYLVPKQKVEKGLGDLEITISENALSKIIEEYTGESGVRSLERQCATVMRKIAVMVASDKKPPSTVGVNLIPKLLGPPKVFTDKIIDVPTVGISTGLAWSQYGGSVLFVESMRTPGKGNIKVTGNAGKVLQESADAAFTWIRSHSKEYGIDLAKINEYDIHVHLPAGATPKDGPSAGIAMTASLLSTILNVPVRNDVAMTGEISLRGRVLPIGGLKEKVLAAHRAGIKTIIFPQDNLHDTDDIPADVLNDLQMVPVTDIKDALKILLSIEPVEVTEIKTSSLSEEPIFSKGN